MKNEGKVEEGSFGKNEVQECPVGSSDPREINLSLTINPLQFHISLSDSSIEGLQSIIQTV